MLPKILERKGPLGGALLTLLLLIVLRPGIEAGLLKDISDLYTVFFSVACGFIATSLSILFTVQDREFAKGLKSSGAFNEIVAYHWGALRWSTFVIFFTAFALIFLKQSSTPQNETLFYKGITLFCLAMGMGAFLAVLRVSYLFVIMLRLDRPNQ